MRNIAVVKSNIRKMIDRGATEEELTEYATSQGYTKQQIKNYKIPKLEAGTKSFLSGITGGFSDELIGGAAAGLLKATGKDNGRSFSDLYQDIRGEERGALNEARNQHPGISFSSELAGGIVPGIGAAGLAGKAGLSGLKGAAASNAGLGAIYGAGNARNLEDIPEEAVGGAAISGALGAGLHGIFNPKEAATGLFRRISPRVNSEAVQAFQKAGVEPTLGQVSESGIIKSLESTLEKIPGAAGKLEAARERTLEQVQNQIKRISPAEPITQQAAGEIIQKGAGQYVKRFKNVSSKMYSRLDKHVKPTQSINTDNIRNGILETIKNLPREGAANNRAKTNAAFRIMDDMVQDLEANGNKLDYKTAKYYRTEIGSEIDKNLLVGDTNNAALKKLYGALSEDMQKAFEAKSPRALQEFKKANSFYHKGREEIEKKLTKLINNQYPEKIFNEALSGTKQGGNKINAIIKTLDPTEKELLRSTVLDKFGKNQSGDFSPSFFIKNYKTLAPEARAALFDNKQIKALNNLNKVLESIKSVEKKANTSNTATHQRLGNMIGLAASGEIFGLSSTLAGLALANITSSKLFTNPSVINWLAKASKIPISSEKMNKNTLSQVINNIEELSKIASANPDIREEILDFLDNL
ncbi:MAG: hypothetical protein ULS35scaffold63_29 [Phage 33_17]|nr:MAG: hypothetical protein ULS35scaffold63_29 [Phage 33_17]